MISAAIVADVAPPIAPEKTPAHHAVFLDLLGVGLLYSVNYEYVFERPRIGLRFGASFFTYGVSKYEQSSNLSILSFPILANYFLAIPRHPNHVIEFGLGTTVLYTSTSKDSKGVNYAGDRAGFGIAAAGTLGYRYLPVAGGFTFGAAFTPLLRSGGFLPWGGVNAGWFF